MNELPSGWKVTTIADVASVSKEKGIPSSDPHVRFVGMEHVVGHMGIVSEKVSGSNYVSSAPKVQDGFVCYGRLRPYLNKVFLADETLYVSGEFIPLVPNSLILPKFLMHRLLAQDFVQFAIELNAGDRPRVKWEQMRKFELVLPPIDEQVRIIDRLDLQLSRLDSGIQIAQNAVKRGQNLRRSLLHDAFSAQLLKEANNVR